MSTTLRQLQAALLLFLVLGSKGAAEGAAIGIGTLQTESWSIDLMHLGPRGDFQEVNRSIQAANLGVTRGWRFSSGVELVAGTAWLHAQGETQEPFDPQPPRNSDADGLRVFGGLRLNSPDPIGEARLFVDGTAGLLWSPGNPFPAGGTAVNGMVTWGIGTAVPLTPTIELELGWRQAHVSNGGGLVDYNPAWDSEGAFLGVRRLIVRR